MNTDQETDYNLGKVLEFSVLMAVTSLMNRNSLDGFNPQIAYDARRITSLFGLDAREQLYSAIQGFRIATVTGPGQLPNEEWYRRAIQVAECATRIDAWTDNRAVEDCVRVIYTAAASIGIGEA